MLQKSNKAKRALSAMLVDMIQDMDRPMSFQEMVRLSDVLKNTNSHTYWGRVITRVFTNGGDEYRTLVKQLSSAAVDDPRAMSDVIGLKATIFLLRFFSHETAIP